MVGVLRLPLTALLLGAAVALAFPAPAQAGDLEDFQIARAAYDGRDWARAVALFEELVGTDPPRLTSTLLILESRKYLGAAYFSIGRREAAGAQFELLLRSDPTYELDASSFPVEVVEMFDYIRSEIQEEARLREDRAADEARHARDEARIRALIEFAEQDVELEVERSRLIAAIPFGVGQFDRGEDGLGAFFLASEAFFFASAALSLGLYIYALDAAREIVRRGATSPDDPRVGEVNRLLLGTEITNWISVGAFGILATAGVLEAELNFTSRSLRHRRTVPPELLEGVEVSVGLGTFSLRASF